MSIFWCFWGYIQRGLVSRVDLVTVFLSMESLDSARTTRHLRSRRARLGDSPSIIAHNTNESFKHHTSIHSNKQGYMTRRITITRLDF